jgi:cytochrome c oxidase cbb3-type subunit 2
MGNFGSKKGCTLAIAVAFMVALSLAVTRAYAEGEAAVDGKEVYNKHCAPCHGEEGTGDGPVAKAIFPKPRDFTQGWYKIRTTPSGSLPSDEDILRTIYYGIPGTSMIPWDVLSEDERNALVPVLKGFSEVFDVRKPEPAVEIGLEIRSTQETIALGKKIYEEKECWKCHGEEGMGDGPSSNELVDDWEYPILPFDFTKGSNLRGGNSDRDIYLRFTTGMTGTPMPSFATELTNEQRWHLVHYVRSLMKPALVAKGEGAE